MSDVPLLLFFREEDGPPNNFTMWIRDSYCYTSTAPLFYSYTSTWTKWKVKGKWWMPNAEWVWEGTYTKSGSEIRNIENFEFVGQGSPNDRHPWTNAMMA